jgi:uncharacterized protein YcfL
MRKNIVAFLTAFMLLAVGCVSNQDIDLKGQVDKIRPELLKTYPVDSVIVLGPDEVSVAMPSDAAHKQKEIAEFVQKHTSSKVKVVFALE